MNPEPKPGAAPDTAPRPLLTIPDLARLLDMTDRGARAVLERGELPGFRLGRRWYLRPEDLDAAISKKVSGHRRDRGAATRVLRGLPAGGAGRGGTGGGSPARGNPAPGSPARGSPAPGNPAPGSPARRT